MMLSLDECCAIYLTSAVEMVGEEEKVELRKKTCRKDDAKLSPIES